MRAGGWISMSLSMALLSVAMSCRDRDAIVMTGSRSSQFGAARLATQFVQDRQTERDVALVHILFVPPFQPEKSNGFGQSGRGGGSRDHLTFDYSYYEFNWEGTVRELRSHSVEVLEGKTVRADGQSFELAAGNVFVAHVDLDGTLQLTQLPSTPYDDAAAVLDAIKRQLPADEWVQQVKARSS